MQFVKLISLAFQTYQYFAEGESNFVSIEKFLAFFLFAGFIRSFEHRKVPGQIFIVFGLWNNPWRK